MKIFVDANVIIDYLVDRMPFADDAEAVIDACVQNGNEGAFTGLTACNAVYVIGRSIGQHNAELLVKEVAEFMKLLPISPEDISMNLGADHPDLEDTLQIAAAKAWGVRRGCDRHTRQGRICQFAREGIGSGRIPKCLWRRATINSNLESWKLTLKDKAAERTKRIAADRTYRPPSTRNFGRAYVPPIFTRKGMGKKMGIRVRLLDGPEVTQVAHVSPQSSGSEVR